jgi:hypothetical protein
VPGSYSLTFDTSTGPLVIPFPSPYPNGGTPYFVVRNNDPHVDGFYFSTDNLDYPFTAFWVNDVARFAPYFQQAFEVSYPEDRLPSLDIYDATGTYNYDGLSVFYFSIIDGGFDAMFVDYTDMTISRVPVEVPVDFRPGGCPNPLNPTTVGVLPVAILGTGSLDVATIDPASIRLNGVPALRSSIEDVGAPFYPVNGKNDCSLDCEASDPDGIADLTLKFDTRAVAATLGDVGTGACVVLHLTGNFLGSTDDGGPIAGEDVAVVVGLGLGHRISGADRIRSGSPAFVVPQPTSPGTSLQLP